MSFRAKIRLSAIFFIMISFLALSFVQRRIIDFRGMPGKLLLKPGEFAVLVAIGGLRGVAADLLYLKSDRLWQEGKWQEMLGLFRAITVLQPNYVDYWSIAGSHLAWNLAFNAPNKQDKQRYIDQGIECFLEGISYNPDSYQLYFDLGFIYHHQVESYEQALELYRMAVRLPGHPTYMDRAIAHVLRKKGDLRGAYQEWLHLEKIYPDDEFHQEIVKKNLKIIKDELEAAK